MKRILPALLACLLLCGLTACFGGGEDNPTTVPEAIPTQTTTTEAGSTAAPVSPDELSQRLIDEIFQPAIKMHGILCCGGASYDFEDRFGYDDWENNRWEYAHITDPRFSSRAAVEEAALKIFSEELVKEYMGLTAESWLSEDADEARIEIARQLPLLMEKDGKLYTLIGNRGGNLSLHSIRIESQSESKIVYALRAVSPWEGEPVVDEEYFYTRELIGGKWVFTVFPTEWI
ncbi:MAG: hypothetical protein FWC27_09475 [Firmicutes bacterium]|nr:hypothetical protein [Bacillota bacterium]